MLAFNGIYNNIQQITYADFLFLQYVVIISRETGCGSSESLFELVFQLFSKRAWFLVSCCH